MPITEREMESMEPVEAIEQLMLGEGKSLNIGTQLPEAKKVALWEFLKKHEAVFAWSAADMPELSRQVAEHRLHVNSGMKPVQQWKRRLGPERQATVKEEVSKLLKVGFIREIKCPKWIANTILVKKSNGSWRMCVDYTDLNKACSKDSFPLPSIDQLVDSTAGFRCLSFMDGFSGYNQIKMLQTDEHKTTFVTDQGLYYYKVMPFGLKNIWATYQRMVNKVFHKQLGRNMKAYIDDMVVKIPSAVDHLVDLEEAFSVMMTMNMKLNPTKSLFRLSGEKFFGFIVSERGIEIHPSKCQAITNIQPSKIAKEV
jgi:Reverse transcriptase (RNA-dependent DNA polymerase)